jgi:hypothetical protein
MGKERGFAGGGPLGGGRVEGKRRAEWQIDEGLTPASGSLSGKGGVAAAPVKKEDNESVNAPLAAN